MAFIKSLVVLSITVLAVKAAILPDRPRFSDVTSCPKFYTKAGDNCFRAYTVEATYAEAHKLCQIVGARLAAPSSQIEVDGLAQMLNAMPKHADYFLRMKEGSDSCTYVGKTGEYEPLDTPCDDILYFVCQR